MQEVILLKLVGSGLASLAPIWSLQDAARRAAASDPDYTLSLMTALTREAPERIGSFTKAIVARLWENCHDELTELDGDQLAETLIELLHGEPLTANLAATAADRVRAEDFHRDAIAQEARRLASAILAGAGGGDALRARGADPLAVLAIVDNLYAALLTDLPFLDDIAPQIAAGLRGDPTLPKLPQAWRNEAAANLKSAGVDDARGFDQVAALSFFRFLEELEAYRERPEARSEMADTLSADVAHGSGARAAILLPKLEGAHLQDMTADLANSAVNARLAATLRTLRADMSEAVADFDRAIRHRQSTLRILRATPVWVRWSYIVHLTETLAHRALFAADPVKAEASVSEAAATLDVALSELPTEGADVERAEAAAMLALITLLGRPAQSQPARWETVIALAETALPTLESLGLDHAAIRARHLLATALRLRGAIHDSQQDLDAACDRYQDLIADLDANPGSARQETNSGQRAPRRDLEAALILADCRYGLAVSQAHRACVNEDTEALSTAAALPSDPGIPRAPFAFTTSADIEVARLRTRATAAILSEPQPPFTPFANEIAQALDAGLAGHDAAETVVLWDLLATLEAFMAAATPDNDPAGQAHLTRAIAAKQQAADRAAACAHPRAHDLAADLASWRASPALPVQ